MGQLHQDSVELYKTLEEETGQAAGFHNTGNLQLATNRDRMDGYGFRGPGMATQFRESANG